MREENAVSFSLSLDLTAIRKVLPVGWYFEPLDESLQAWAAEVCRFLGEYYGYRLSTIVWGEVICTDVECDLATVILELPGVINDLIQEEEKEIRLSFFEQGVECDVVFVSTSRLSVDVFVTSVDGPLESSQKMRGDRLSIIRNLCDLRRAFVVEANKLREYGINLHPELCEWIS